VAAPTESYVDPSIAANTGAGTIGDPWGDLQYGLDQVTRDATNGDRFNIKSGTAELITVSLSLVTYGTPSFTAPLIFQGYASAAGDGDLDAGTGIGEIDMQGNNNTIIAAGAGICFMHLHCHGTGTAIVLTIGTDQAVLECEVSEGTGGGIVSNTDNRVQIIGNHVHDTGSNGIDSGGLVAFNYLKNDGTTDFVNAIQVSAGTYAIGNFISIDGSTIGIEANPSRGVVSHNSILSAGGTGVGIKIIADGPLFASLMNNIIEGFSGAGGKGIRIAAATRTNVVYARNAVFNCTTDYDDSGKSDWLLVNDNEVLSATLFDKSGSDTFANRFTYFSPVDTGNVHGGAYVG